MDRQKAQSIRYESANPYAAYTTYEEQLQRPSPQASRRDQTTLREERFRSSRYNDSDVTSSEDEDYSDDDRYRSRRRRRSEEFAPVRRSRSVGYNTPKRDKSPRRSRHPPSPPPETYTIAKAVKSAAMAATVEAVRCRAEPGPWRGQKGARVATAAVSGGIVGVLRNGKLRKDGKLPIAEAAMTGIYAVDFLKRVLRQTGHEKGAEEERKKRIEEVESSDEEEYERVDRRRLRSRSRARSPSLPRSRSMRRRMVDRVEYR